MPPAQAKLDLFVDPRNSQEIRVTSILTTHFLQDRRGRAAQILR